MRVAGCFTPKIEMDTDYAIIRCYHEDRCTTSGETCAELAACELLQARCAKWARRGKCHGQCRSCGAAVAG